MKKQLLLVTLALFAGILSYGQAEHNSDPRGTSCVDDPLHPIAGKAYDYQATADPAGGSFLFWATKETNFISTTNGVTTPNLTNMLNTPTQLLAKSDNYGVSGNLDAVSITWSDAILSATDPATSPTFVAVHYTALPEDCADNFRVWSIEPILAFTVDIKNIENEAGTLLGYDVAEEQCVDIVRGANYVGSQVEYDFGTQVLYYEVVAANFSGSFTPTFEVTGLHAVQEAVIEYTVTPPPFTGATWVTATSGTAASPVTTTVTETNLGVSIYVRVTITNNNYEGSAPLDITLAVDAQNSADEWDINNGAGDACIQTTGPDQLDKAIQTLTPRPALTPNPTPFVTGNNQG